MKGLKIEKNKKSIFEKLFVSNCYCWVSAVCAALICIIVAYCYDMIPFGDITILRMDMYHQYCPLFAELYDRVTGLQSFMYSWETGLGSSFIGNFYNYLCSPSAIFVLLFGHQNVPAAIAAMIFSKSAFAAAAFTYYIKKAYGRSDFATAGFGILYCMCGWFIAYYWDVMWVDSMVFFPFVILGIERIINERKAITYVSALFLTLLTNYYMGYMVCIFSVLYFLFYYFSKNSFTQSDSFAGYWTKPNGKKSMTLYQRFMNSVFFRSGITFASASFLAAMLCAFALVPVFFILQNSYATSDNFPSTWDTYFTIFDFIANHITSVEPTIRSSGDVVLPNVWCGIGTIMLVPLYLFTKSIPLKEKISTTALLAILFASFNVNMLSFVWHAFHYPSDLPYRFSFMYCFILLNIAFKTFTRIKEFTSRQILGTAVAFIAFVIMVQKSGSVNVEDTTVYVSIIFIIIYALILFAGQKSKYQKSTVAVMLLCCIIGETVCATVPHYDIDQPQKNFAGDYVSFKALKNRIDSKDDDEFYRMELTYNRARMSPAWYGYNGVSTFTSMAYESLSELEKYLGLAGNNVDSYTYHLQTPVYNMMHSLKYIYDNDNNVDVEDDYYTKLDSEGDFTAYSVNHYLPIAYCVNNDVEQWYYSDSDPFSVQEEWFELSTGVPFTMERMDISDVTYYNVDEITTGLTTGEIYYEKTTPGEEGEITFYIGDSESRHCYLYVDSSQFESISIDTDGRDVTQSIDEPYVWDLGVISQESQAIVTITVDSEDDYGSFDFDVFAMNDIAIDEGYEILKENQIDITSFSDSKITGKITVPEGKMIYTSIPYDKGWTVKLNGEKVSEDDIIALGEGFLCIKADPGEYDIEFTFVQRGLIPGTIISICALVILIAVLLFIRMRRKKNLAITLNNFSASAIEIPEEEPLKDIIVTGDNESSENIPAEAENDDDIKNT